MTYAVLYTHEGDALRCECPLCGAVYRMDMVPTYCPACGLCYDGCAEFGGPVPSVLDVRHERK